MKSLQICKSLILLCFAAKFSECVNMSHIMKINPRHLNNTSANYASINYKSGKQLSDNQKKSAQGTAEIRFIFVPPDLNFLFLSLNALNNNKCRRDSISVLSAIMRYEKWAMKMFDSSAKFPTGILYGSYYQLGNFDECVSAEQPLSSIKGQYCIADVTRGNFQKNVFAPRGTYNNTLHWAVCVPSSCSPNEVQNFLVNLLQNIIVDQNLSVQVHDSMCHYDQKLSYNATDLTYLIVIIAFLAFIVYSTSYHLIYISKKIRPKTTTFQILRSFSVVYNVRKMLNVKSAETGMEFICGIRFLSMLLIISGHSLLFLIGAPVMNSEFTRDAVAKFRNGLFVNNPLLVDTFLVMSGFLMCRLLLLELDKRKGRLNFLYIYCGRYIRLTPVYAVVIGFYCTYLIKLDTGPLWNLKNAVERNRCLESWWSNLLYVNNYVNADSLCMFQSWYLSVDTQLFVIAPFFIYPLWRWRKIGEISLISGAVVTTIIPFIITYQNKLDPTLMLYASEVQDVSSNSYFKNVYIKTHMRASSYFIGLIYGYLVHRIQSSGFKLGKYKILTGWILAVICAVISMFSVAIFYYPDHKYNVLESAIYASCHRVAWSFGIGWVMFACMVSNFDSVKKFLSWKVFISLSRLTYCSYLVNGLILLHNFGTIRAPIYLGNYSLASAVLSHNLMTFVSAFVLCVLFESPIHSLEKIFIGLETRKRVVANG